MLPSTDPAVTALERELRDAEGPFTVLSRYYTNSDVADAQRRLVAERLTRAVDRARADLQHVQLSLVLEGHA